MTKKQLVEAVAIKAKITNTLSRRIVDVLIREVGDSLKKGGKVVIAGFGTFHVSNRNARTGRNPQTGDAIEIPAHKAPVFTAGKKLKRLLK